MCLLFLSVSFVLHLLGDNYFLFLQATSYHDLLPVTHFTHKCSRSVTGCHWHLVVFWPVWARVYVHAHTHTRTHTHMGGGTSGREGRRKGKRWTQHSVERYFWKAQWAEACLVCGSVPGNKTRAAQFSTLQWHYSESGLCMVLGIFRLEDKCK